MSARAAVARRAVLVAATALAGAAAAVAQVPLAEWAIERSERRASVAAGREVRVENPWGDVRVRPAPATELYLVINAQRHRDDPRQTAVEIDDTGAALVVRAVLPEAAGGEPAAWALRRVDLSLLVPPDSPLTVLTEEGTLEVKGHAAPLTARTTSGDIRLRVGARVEALSERGAILAVLRTVPWREPVRFESATGAIEILVPARTDAVVEIATRGELVTDFSIDVERLAHGEKRATARLGGGGERIVLRGDQGPVKLLQIPETGPPAGGGRAATTPVTAFPANRPPGC